MTQEKVIFEQNQAQLEPIKQRLYALMDYYGQSKSEFAKHIGTTLNVLNVYYKRQTLSRVLITSFLKSRPSGLARVKGQCC